MRWAEPHIIYQLANGPFSRDGVKWQAWPLIVTGPGLVFFYATFVCFIDGRRHEIPIGTPSNFGTVPWFLRWFVSVADPLFYIAFLLHDAWCGEYNRTTYGWDRANRMAYRVMRALTELENEYIDKMDDVPRWRRFVYKHWRRLLRHAIFQAIRIKGVLAGDRRN